jgi:nucleotide-binding universal stress UspA family protein
MIKILVPYDFSKVASHALDFATKLSATYTKLHITLLHVIEFPLNASVGTLGGGVDPLTDFQNQVYFKELVQKRKEELEQLKKSNSAPSYTLDTVVLQGNTFKEISGYMTEKKPDLIVMGSTGSTGWEEMWIGSTTEKIVRTASCPVITIKKKTDPLAMKKVVFASNFNELDSVLATRIKNMQHVFDAQFYFLSVNTPGDFKSSRESMARLKKFIKTYKFENIKAEIYNSLSEESGILEFADDIGADLIAMSTHGRTGFLHLLTGSIAEDVVNHSARPVWTLKTAVPDK